jgi:ammonia channel protein AmtB
MEDTLTTIIPEAAEATIGLDVSINNIWLLVAAFLVMFMQPGFAMVEAGFTRQKNMANILMKNLMDFSIGSLTYWIVGYSIMYGESLGGLIGSPLSNFGFSPETDSYGPDIRTIPI